MDDGFEFGDASMPFHALADDLAGGNIERREQRRRAVALVVMQHSAGLALLHRQARLGAVELLDLALLVRPSAQSSSRLSGQPPTTRFALAKPASEACSARKPNRSALPDPQQTAKCTPMSFSFPQTRTAQAPWESFVRIGTLVGGNLFRSFDRLLGRRSARSRHWLDRHHSRIRNRLRDVDRLRARLLSANHVQSPWSNRRDLLTNSPRYF